MARSRRKNTKQLEVQDNRVKINKTQPKSEGQEYLQKILDCNKYSRILVTGPSGSGKTRFISEKVAEKYLSGKIDKIYLVRSLEPVSEENEIGWLKGDIEAKMLPWVAPILQHLGKFLPVSDMISNKEIEFIPLEMIRGLSLESEIGCVVFATEIQNISIGAYKALLTRVGKNCTLYMDGDEEQSDRSPTDLMEIFERLDATVHRFSWVDLCDDDIFRDKDTVDILKVFRELGY